MDWEVFQARNGENSLLLNGVSIYSRYNPSQDARKWINAEFKSNFPSYFLIGLGLGYHLRSLIEQADAKEIVVYCFEEQELKLFMDEHGQNDWWEMPNVHIVRDLKHVDLDEKAQILIPNVWIKGIGENHPLLPFLEDIKINQVTYEKSSLLMEKNFHQNVSLRDFHAYPTFKEENACLVSSGPSLNETIYWLKEKRKYLSIFSVGSALNVLLKHGISPDAVIISDPKLDIKHQIDKVNYLGPLFYVSTANFETVNIHGGPKYILLQNGYKYAEELAKEIGHPLLETGGSVATIALSLLENLNFDKIFLFGQDLGFSSNATHAEFSSSGRIISEDRNIRIIEANDGSQISTTPNLHTYLRWLNSKVQRMSIPVFNTASRGAKIDNVPCINYKQFDKLL